MSLEKSSLPSGFAPFLGRIADKAVEITTSASNNIAKDNAVQVCGPVAGSIQYVINLSLHYHAGEIDTCYCLIGETTVIDKITSTSVPAKNRRALLNSPEKDLNLDPKRASIAPEQCIQQVCLSSPTKGPSPVLVTFDPGVEGYWIAAAIVKRFNFKHQQAKTHKQVPIINDQRFKDTRIYVDLTCGKMNGTHQCQHRFYVVNHCDYFDILLGKSIP